jgi:hypothetical protein
LLALVIAVVAHLIMAGGLRVQPLVKPRLFVWLPICGLVVAGLAIVFSQITGKAVSEVLFDGQSALPGLVSSAGTWSVAALVWLIVFKGIAYAISLGSFRGGPTFPAIFLGGAAGLLASRLPGFPETAAVAVGMGAATVAILRLPLSAVVIASLLTSKSGAAAEPLVIVAVAVSYLVTLRLAKRSAVAPDAPSQASAPAAPPSGPAASAPTG